jgi:hypothetical protein
MTGAEGDFRVVSRILPRTLPRTPAVWLLMDCEVHRGQLQLVA